MSICQIKPSSSVSFQECASLVARSSSSPGVTGKHDKQGKDAICLLALIQVIHMFMEIELLCAGAPSTVADGHAHSAFNA